MSGGCIRTCSDKEIVPTLILLPRDLIINSICKFDQRLVGECRPKLARCLSEGKLFAISQLEEAALAKLQLTIREIIPSFSFER